MLSLIHVFSVSESWCGSLFSHIIGQTGHGYPCRIKSFEEGGKLEAGIGGREATLTEEAEQVRGFMTS